VKSVAGRKTSGFVNAVLRRMIECVARREDRPLHRLVWENRLDELPLAGGGSVALTAELLPREPCARLAVATGLQMALLELLERSHTRDEVEAFALHSLAKGPVILNSAHCRQPLPEGLCVPHAIAGSHVFTGNATELGQLLAGRDDLWVQDPASAAALAPAAGLTPSLIVDVCAGRGTKTRQLRAMFPGARILATDVNPDRLSVLEQVFEKDEQVSVIPLGGLGDWANQTDLALLDAPCFNTGVLGRRPEARHRWSARSVRKLRDVQRRIIADSIGLLAPHGALLYATCSVDPRENEDQIAWIKQRSPLRLAQIQQRWPTDGPEKHPTRSSDGGFSALLT